VYLENINSPKDLKKLSIKELETLSGEIREKIIEVMSRNGGHLASSLGVVELTIALHYVFDMPDDMLIFDVGHQSYTHKILTGRRKEFELIRKKGGISGFTRRKESVYDPVDSGHSATSISSAVGFACANRLNNINNHIIVVIGDGSLTGGEAFEGLNFAGHLEMPLIIILNDNEMSIGENIGGIKKNIGKITVSKPYQKLTRLYYYIMRNKKGLIKTFFWFAKKVEKGLKIFLGLDNVFFNLGFEYIGPIDGHNLRELIYIFERTKKNISYPVVFHLKTKKGKGYLQAEDNPSVFHGVTPNLMNFGKVEVKEEKSFTEVFADKVLSMGKEHKEIVTVTAAMEDGTGLTLFKNEFPKRFFDVGIAEQHAVTFSAALAHGGLRPVLAIYSTFLMRALDQLTQDVCISCAPVIFCIDRAGIVGADGETHQGQFDISFLNMLPNLTIMAPSCTKEMELMLDYAYSLNKPVAIRYPRDIALSSQLDNNHPPLNENPFIILENGNELLIIVIGPFINTVKESILVLKQDHINCGIIYLRILKPFSEKLINEIIKYKAVLVIEENVFNGSISQEIGSLISESGHKIFFSSISLPDAFVEHDLRKNILKELGFDKEGIVLKSKKLIKKINNYSKV